MASPGQLKSGKRDSTRAHLITHMSGSTDPDLLVNSGGEGRSPQLTELRSRMCSRDLWRYLEVSRCLQSIPEHSFSGLAIAVSCYTGTCLKHLKQFRRGYKAPVNASSKFIEPIPYARATKLSEDALNAACRFLSLISYFDAARIKTIFEQWYSFNGRKLLCMSERRTTDGLLEKELDEDGYLKEPRIPDTS